MTNTTWPTKAEILAKLRESYDEWKAAGEPIAPWGYPDSHPIESDVEIGPVRVAWSVRDDSDEDILDRINDFDESIWGRLQYGECSSTREYDRPDDFDGNAERIDKYNPGTSQGDYEGLWWQPPDPKGGAPARGTPEFDKMRSDLCELLTFGFCGIVVDVYIVTPEGVCPHCGRGAEVRHGSNSLGGIEQIGDPEFDYKWDVLSDCFTEAVVEADPTGHYIQVDET